MAVQRALATVREAPFIVDVLRAADDLALAAARNGGRRAADLLTEAVEDDDDELTAIAAVHALGRVFDDQADAVLSDLLSHQRGFLREHAAWTLAGRLPRLDAIGRLIGVVTAGGFSGMLAQRTLAQWARAASDHVALALEGAIAVQHDLPSRARLVETLGLVPGDLAGGTVLRIAADRGEDETVRVVAVGALGDRVRLPGSLGSPGLIRDLSGLILELSGQDGELGAVARLAVVDAGLAAPGAPSTGTGQDLAGAASDGAENGDGGLTIAQLFLHADIDRELSSSGMGDNGGVATLLLRLGDALAVGPGVRKVLTLSRGSAQDAAATLLESAPGRHVLAPVPLLRAPTGATAAWPARVAAERGIRRALRAHGPVDVLHLRMADVGSLAADAVAQELGIPVVFTLAPDPHAVIHSLDMTGALTRSGFGSADEQEHYWFRARLVQRLAANAAHNVLFPRPELRHDLRELLGIEVAEESHRYTVVPEGIDLTVTEAARAEVAAAGPGTTVGVGGPGVAAPGAGGAISTVRTLVATGGSSPALRDLAGLVAALPGHRHGLPLALSVGRLHPVKGMATVVEAWAGDPELRAGCNLLIVGGDLEHPSPQEQEQLDRIHALAPVAGSPSAHPDAPDAGLILAGHRPNDVVARWLAAAEHGLAPLVGAGGVYVCGSLKEEFGLAVVEALAAGLVVLAPGGGGPATYVEPGVTGLLVNTREPGELAAGIRSGLELAAGPGGVERERAANRLVRDRLTVQAMAATLTGIYAEVGERANR